MRRQIVWLYHQHHVARPMIRLAIQTLQAADCSVCVIDSDTQAVNGPYRHIALGQLPWFDRYESGTLEQMNSTLSRFLYRLGLIRQLLMDHRDHLLTVVAAWQTLRQRPDVIVASYVTMAFMGALVAKLLKARFVYYPHELLGDQGVTIPGLWMRGERWVLREAIDALITQNEARAQVYRQERGARVPVTIVYNYKPAHLAAPSNQLHSLLSLPADCKIVLYEGVFNSRRWLIELARSALFLPDNTWLVFMGRRNTWWDEKIEPLLHESNLQSKIKLAPWIEQAELLNYVAEADVGVVIYDDSNRNNYYCAPGKLSDYVMAGVPMVVPNFPTIAPLIRERGLGAVFDSSAPEEIARAIKSVLTQPRSHWQSALVNAQADFRWETQEASLRQAILGDR